MMNPPAQGLNTYLMLRVSDTVRLRMRHQCATLVSCDPAPHCFQFDSGALNGAPEVRNVCLTPMRGGCGCCLDAQLCLPVCLRLMRECEFFTVAGSLPVPIQAALRCPCPCPCPLQFFPQVDLCILDVQLSGGCLCVVFDLTATLYAACLEPVQLPVVCAPRCVPDCTPFFNMPLYPELPRPR